ncbi:MAG: [protein-PII] uridylyltransferase [Acidimicrobiales bacterium]|nr:[protein-PII] uridylyltransferase [Acidimicrobiales bacterium]
MRDDRDRLIADPDVAGADLCRALSDTADRWLAGLFAGAIGEAVPERISLVATGGYGRGELSPSSDLDLVLLHDGRDDITEIAERLWYPIWDSGQKLGHAVRTVGEAVRLADSDLDTATSLLDCRHLAGDESLTDRLRDTALERWRKRAKRWLGELSESVRQRHERAGEVAFLLEPDLKEGRGGLRDVHALRWAQAARSVLLEGDDDALVEHYATLLSVRVELHRRTGRPGDRLLLEEQDGVAAALGYDDADDLMRAVATAARAIAWRSDETWRRIDSSLTGPLGRLVSRDRWIGGGLVVRDGEVTVTPDADLTDPVLPLRAAATATSHGTTIDRASIDTLAEVPPLPEPWPTEARERFVELLLAGRGAIPVVELLDHHGLWARIIPEWTSVHCKPQRNAYHRFTVDRHLLEAAVNASTLTDRVDRPDLLVVGTLLHDIGKGRPGDHTEVGIEMVRTIGTRMGFTSDDIEMLVQMVRHHLLLPDVATRRDLADEGTLTLVAEAAGSLRVLRLLDALTEADSLATGPAAWGDWKAGLVRTLVARSAHLLAGGDLADILPPGFPTGSDRDLMESGGRHIVVDDDTITVVDADIPGLFSRVAGALALQGATVLAASAWSDRGRAIAQFRVASDPTVPVDWDAIFVAVESALDGRLAIAGELAQRARTTRTTKRRAAHVKPTRVIVDNEISEVATVVEVHTPEQRGVLYRITSALAELGHDIRSARIQTLGHEVVDSFYLLDADGAKVTDPAELARLEAAITTALDTRT